MKPLTLPFKLSMYDKAYGLAGGGYAEKERLSILSESRRQLSLKSYTQLIKRYLIPIRNCRTLHDGPCASDAESVQTFEGSR